MTGFNSKRRMALAKLEPTPWRDMVTVSLVREGINKHKARELADHFATLALLQDEPPPEWELINNIIAEYGLDAIAFVSEWKAALGQAEPVAWTTMPKAADWDFVSGSKDPTGKLEGKWVPLYTTPPAAQRPWVGLTDDDWAKVGDMPDTFDQGVAWAAARLKEKNT